MKYNQIGKYIKIYGSNQIILKLLLIFLGILYLYLGSLPKHRDFWNMLYVSKTFAGGSFDFYEEIIVNQGLIEAYIAYPPTFYIFQGLWIKFVSNIFNYNLASWTHPEIYPPYFFLFLGMIPHLFALYLFVLISYFSLKNKWLTLVCFATITFVSIIIMGQIDIFVVLFIYLSMIFAIKSAKNNNIQYFFISIILLGISVQFKTYGGLLLPIFLIYFASLLKRQNYNNLRIIKIMISLLIIFIISSLFVWLPYLKWFIPIIIEGESSWILNLQISPINLKYHDISIWLLGYVLLIYYIVKDFNNLINIKYFAFYNFTVTAWFFISVFSQPQWWMFLLPPLLLILDNFGDKKYYLFCIILFVLFLFYPMMWVNNIDVVLTHYLPVISITSEYATILSTLIVTLLIVWIIELKNDLTKLRDSND